MGAFVRLNDWTINMISCRLLVVGDLQEVAELHRRAFKDSALTKLGFEPVRRYYEWQLIGPHDCYAVGAFDEDRSMVGFCFAGVFRGSLSGFIEKNKKFLIVWLLTHPWLFFNSLVIDRLKIVIKLKQKKGKEIKDPKPYIRSFGILSIAIDPEKQGLGIGKLIMQAVEKECRERGYRQMNLTVHPTNSTAIAFYENCEWKKLTAEGEWGGSMYKEI